MFRFEKLQVWQEAISYADLIYTLSDGFPTDERFGLTSQMRRAAVSISSNIAEGTGRSSDVDYAHFVTIAYGSLMETVSQAYVAKQRGFLDSGELEQLREHAERVARMLSGLRNSLLKDHHNPP